MQHQNYKAPQQHRMVVNVPSIRYHLDVAFSCRLKVHSDISGLCSAAGRLFHRDRPATVKLRRPIMIRALGTCSRPVEVDPRTDDLKQRQREREVQ